MTTLAKRIFCREPTCERKRFSNRVLIALAVVWAVMFVVLHVNSLNIIAAKTEHQRYEAAFAPDKTTVERVSEGK